MTAPEHAAAATTPVRSGRRRRRRRRAPWIVGGILAALVALLVSVGILANQAYAAQSDLRSALELVPEVESALAAGDGARAADALAVVQPLTESARANTDGPLWWLAARIPGVGTDVDAFSTSAAAVDDLVQDVLPPLTSAVDVLTGDALSLAGGAIDLEPLEAVAPQVSSAAAALADVDARMDAIDTTELLGVLAGPVGQLQDKTSELVDLVGAAETITTLLPPMLGADGPRTYLLLALTNAELRSSGGIPGAMVLLEADGGRLRLVDQATSGDVGPFGEPVLPLDPVDEELYSANLGRFVQDVTLTPDFPTSARLAAQMWQEAHGQELDGVIATDPVALSLLLERTGPIEVAGVGLDTENVADVLLTDAYRTFADPEAVDDFFATVAASVFATALSGVVGPGDLQETMAAATGERRLFAWSADEAEQAQLDETLLAGGFFSSEHAADDPGVFFNDGTRGKMSAYLRSDIEVVESRCTADGRIDTIRLDLRSAAPEDAATSLPAFVTGYDAVVEPGVVRTSIAVHSPVGGQVVGVSRGESVVAGSERDAHGRETFTFPLDLDPGEETSMRIEVLTPSDAVRGWLDVWSTPTGTSPGLLGIDAQRC
ncbi:DUF4012 domain-containing protein [Oerskovia flava]|uniref:DUF4012 domain-containing protein n=1 Tax=Oerskovia flava TaxID=2986422 RepID=UPI00224052EB|nr:DUF4012 domain-containing protein [Oerskovia sp. JB1-3-2]